MGAIFKTFFKISIRLYQWILSPLLGPRCRFYPSCSSYAYQALEQYSLITAIKLISKRLCRCHPLSDGGIDELPKRGQNG